MRLTHVQLPCADVARSLVFYQGLGLAPLVLDHAPDGTLRYARLTFPEGDATLSLETGDPATAARVVVYFECDDLDARVATLRDGGYAFTAGPETKPWLWREATLIDPDGHRLCLFRAGSYRLDPPWRLPASRAAGGAVDGGPALPEAFLATHNQGYVDTGIPSGRDAQLAAFLEPLLATGDANAVARERAADALTAAYTATFLAYAERMASLAVRARDERPARLGTLAVALTWRGCVDVRPGIPVLGLLFDAARRAGADPRRLFEESAALCPADIAPVLRDFLRREDLDEIAEEMGFSGGRDRDGFRYRRLWGAGRVDDEG